MTTSRSLCFIFLRRLLSVACPSRCDGLGILLVFVDRPVEDIVVLEALADEQITEDLSKIGIVGLVIETKGTGIVQIDGKFVGETTAESLGRGRHLLFHDPIILLLLGGSLQPLPWQRTSAEIEHDISERFHVIATGLFCGIDQRRLAEQERVSLLTDAKVSIDAGITSGTRQVLVLAVRDMEVGLWVSIFLGQTKVNHIHLVASLANTHQEVVRFDVSMDEGFGMDVLDAGDELIGQEQDRLQREFAVAEIEQVFQAGSKEIKNHSIVVTLGTEPADEGDPNTSRQ